MREIKFRSWNEELKTITYWDMYEDYFDTFWSDALTHKEDLEQYTGLEDKNGKEIYFNSDTVEATVIDDFDGSETKMSGIMYICLKTFRIVIKGHEDFNIIFADSLEIIGNIHEVLNEKS